VGILNLKKFGTAELWQSRIFAKFWEVSKNHLAANSILVSICVRAWGNIAPSRVRMSASDRVLNWSGKVRLEKLLYSCMNKFCHNVLKRIFPETAKVQFLQKFEFT